MTNLLEKIRKGDWHEDKIRKVHYNVNKVLLCKKPRIYCITRKVRFRSRIFCQGGTKIFVTVDTW